MPADPNILSSLGLDSLIDDGQFGRDQEENLRDPTGARVVFAAVEAMRSLHDVVENERLGAWRVAMQATGHICGRSIASDLELRLGALGKPALAALPLEACLVLIERSFAIHGWGRLELDLAYAAQYGLVLARVEHSFFVEALPHATDFVDPLIAGMLQGFFEHISGQSLGCEEISCIRHPVTGSVSPALCTFAITAPERLATIRAQLGNATAEALIARLCS